MSYAIAYLTSTLKQWKISWYFTPEPTLHWWISVGLSCITQQIKARIKWPAFFRIHFQMHHIKMLVFWCELQWSLFRMVQLKGIQHWFRCEWHDAEQATITSRSFHGSVQNIYTNVYIYIYIVHKYANRPHVVPTWLSTFCKIEFYIIGNMVNAILIFIMLACC